MLRSLIELYNYIIKTAIASMCRNIPQNNTKEWTLQ